MFSECRNLVLVARSRIFLELAIYTKIQSENFTESMTESNARHWTIIQNDLSGFWKSTPEHPKLRYWCFQIRCDPSTGDWRAEIFMQFERCVKGSLVLGLVGGTEDTAEIWVAADPQSARNHCFRKQCRVTPTEEYGEFDSRTQGYRSDLESEESTSKYRDTRIEDYFPVLSRKN